MNAEKSQRHQLADRIAQVIIENRLTNPFGGDVNLSKQGRPHYTILFSRPAILDGLVSVYNHNFIVIQYTTSIRSLPHTDRRVFVDEESAKKFIDLAFVQMKADEALQIPMKEQKHGNS